jgi:transcription antitermination factor NusG
VVPRTQGLSDVIASSSWGVLVAHHQRTKAVGEELIVRGIDHFIPVEEVTTITRGRRVANFQPIFGEYIFIAVTAAWRSLANIKGVAGFLLNELDFPAQVLPHEMDRMRAMCDGDLMRPKPQKSRFSYGQLVAPQTGPLAFQVGVYDHQTKRGNDDAIFTFFKEEQHIVFRKGELVAA